MGTIRIISDRQLGSIGSTKSISVTSSEVLYQISSGMRAFELANNGSNALIFYGQSSLRASSGLFINTGGGSKFWDSIVDNFSMALRVNSGGITAQAIVQEYLGN